MGKINTDNEFFLSLGQGTLTTLFPVRITTQQQAYRFAAWVKAMGMVLPEEEIASTYEEVEAAVNAT